MDRFRFSNLEVGEKAFLKYLRLGVIENTIAVEVTAKSSEFTFLKPLLDDSADKSGIDTCEALTGTHVRVPSDAVFEQQDTPVVEVVPQDDFNPSDVESVALAWQSVRLPKIIGFAAMHEQDTHLIN